MTSRLSTLFARLSALTVLTAQPQAGPTPYIPTRPAETLRRPDAPPTHIPAIHDTSMLADYVALSRIGIMSALDSTTPHHRMIEDHAYKSRIAAAQYLAGPERQIRITRQNAARHLKGLKI